MSTTDPVPPQKPEGNSAKKWLIGCLVALLLLVALGVAVLMLGIYAVKKQVDAVAPDAQKVLEDARRAAKALESAPAVAPEVTQVAEARMRLGRAASSVLSAAAGLKPEPCPADPARANLSVDAQWFGELANGDLPTEEVGTPWFRHEVFETAAAAAHGSDEDRHQGLIELDRALGQASSVSVIHTTRLVEPRLLDGDKVEGGAFEGFVQVVGYPDGETICIAPFQATTDHDDFQQRFWAAEGAAIGK
jgi:hypothetical protein